MRTKAAVIAVVIAAALAVGAVGALAAGSQTSAKTVKVALKEWTLIPSVKRVPAGSVTFVVTNTGKVGHELVVIKTNKAPKALPMNGSLASEAGAKGEVEVKSGQTKRLTLTLKAGKYVLICNLLGHYKAGQTAAFQVG